MDKKQTALASVATSLLLAFSTFDLARADELRSTLTDQESVAVTIYNEDLALIKDTRRLHLNAGQLDLALRDVSGKIRPETAQLRSLSHAGSFSVLEQNFDFDLLTPEKLLEKFVGRSVGIVRSHPTTGAETIERAEVLSAAQGVVLRMGDRIEVGVPGRIVFDSVPANLRDRPTLVVQLQNKTAADQQLELTYLSGGLAWRADYVAELNSSDTQLDLSGWVTLTNQSGTSFTNAKLQLVAGDVHRVRQEFDQIRPAVARMKSQAREESVGFAEQSLLDYHLYTLGRPTTISDNQTKQVALLSAVNVPAKKEFVLQGADYYYRAMYSDLGTKMKVGVFVETKNDELSHLGMPLPKGTIRVYKKDRDGSAQFVGEDNIDHTPKNEIVRLKLGDAFDVTADKKQSSFRKADAVGRYSYAAEMEYEITIKNAKKESVVVVVKEPIPGDWQMLSESVPHDKAAAHIALWRVNVPAEAQTVLKYKVLVRI